MQREPGFYWVKNQTPIGWSVYVFVDGAWFYTSGVPVGGYFHDSEIGPRITPPEEK